MGLQKGVPEDKSGSREISTLLASAKNHSMVFSPDEMVRTKSTSGKITAAIVGELVDERFL